MDIMTVLMKYFKRTATNCCLETWSIAAVFAWLHGTTSVPEVCQTQYFLVWPRETAYSSLSNLPSHTLHYYSIISNTITVIRASRSDCSIRVLKLPGLKSISNGGFRGNLEILLNLPLLCDGFYEGICTIAHSLEISSSAADTQNTITILYIFSVTLLLAL